MICRRTRAAWKELFENESERLRELYAGWPRHGRGPRKPGRYLNRYYVQNFATVFGTIRLGVARARGKIFLPPGLQQFQRRAPELAMLIREAIVRGLSTRQVGRVVSTLTGEVVSGQTVSRLLRDLDDPVCEFHRAPLAGEWVYLFLDGVRVRRPTGAASPDAGGLRRAARRTAALACLFAQPGARTKALGKVCLGICYRRGLKGEHLQLILTDGCAGLAAAIQTVYSRVLHQRCSVYKMRNIPEYVRKRDYDEVKRGAQAIYRG